MRSRATAVTLLLVSLLFVLAEPARALDESRRAMLWRIMQMEPRVRRIRVALDIGTVEANAFFVRGDSLFLTRIRRIPARDTELAARVARSAGTLHVPVGDIRRCEVLTVGSGRSKPPSPGATAAVSAVAALGLLGGSVALADDGVEWYQAYWNLSLGLVVAGLVVAIPFYHLMSRWQTIEVPASSENPVP